MTFTYLIIFSLATWRISSLLVREDGPGGMFQWLREYAGIVHDSDGNIVMIPETFLAGFLSCVWCSSIWVAFGWTLFWMVATEWAVNIAVVFAFSAGAVIVDRWFG